MPTPENARKWLRVLTAEPHVAGTPADYKTAVFVRDKLREWGWKADLAEQEVLLNYPAEGFPPSLALVSDPIARSLSLDEAPIATDKDSASSAAFGAFNGYGVSGDGRRTGRLRELTVGPRTSRPSKSWESTSKARSSSPATAGIFRGLKVLNAQKRGAEGILIYSDPADDGFAKGDVYPNGRFRPGSAIQRGSVQFLSLGTGRSVDALWPFHQGSEAASDRRPQWIHVFMNHEFDSPTTTSTVRSIADWEKKPDSSEPIISRRSPPFRLATIRRTRSSRSWRARTSPRAGKEGCLCLTTSGRVRPKFQCPFRWIIKFARSGT